MTHQNVGILPSITPRKLSGETQKNSIFCFTRRTAEKPLARNQHTTSTQPGKTIRGKIYGRLKIATMAVLAGIPEELFKVFYTHFSFLLPSSIYSRKNVTANLAQAVGMAYSLHNDSYHTKATTL